LDFIENEISSQGNEIYSQRKETYSPPLKKRANEGEEPSKDKRDTKVESVEDPHQFEPDISEEEMLDILGKMDNMQDKMELDELNLSKEIGVKQVGQKNSPRQLSVNEKKMDNQQATEKNLLEKYIFDEVELTPKQLLQHFHRERLKNLKEWE